MKEVGLVVLVAFGVAAGAPALTWEPNARTGSAQEANANCRNARR